MNLLRQPKTQIAASAGYTFIEIATVIAVVSILSAFAIVSFGNSSEMRDAAMVQAAQASLQSLVSQGSVRMDVRPDQLPANAVLNAIKADVGQQITGSQNQGVTFTSSGANRFTMTIRSSGRSATYRITSRGDVELYGLNNFQNYTRDTSNAIPTIRKK